MQNDTRETLEAINGGEGVYTGKLARDVEAAQSCMVHVSTVRPWAKRLRFLVDVRETGDLDYDFEVITDAIDSSEPYLAVSYCWQPETGTTGTTLLSFDTSRTPKVRVPYPDPLQPYDANSRVGVVRDAKVRLDVLLRSFRFAARNGIRKVWIDQECINQDDPADQEQGIQNMDLVYRNAKFVLVLLGAHMKDPKDFGLLEYAIYGPDDRDPNAYIDPNPPEVEEITKRICTDKWFTRAWTTHEFLVSTEDSIIFLVDSSSPSPEMQGGLEKYSDELNMRRRQRDTADLGEKESFWNGKQSVPEETMLSSNCLWTIGFASSEDLLYGDRAFREASKSWSAIAQQGDGPGAEYNPLTLLEVDVSLLPWWEDDRKVDTKAFSAKRPLCGGHQGVSCQQRFKQTIIESIESVLDKGCLHEADKLALMANICRYEWRLDTRAVAAKGLSFSACILAMALYNGDNSFSFFYHGHEDFLDDDEAREWWNTASPNRAIPRWLPMENSQLHMEELGGLQKWLRTGGKRCVVLDGKLAIEGLLWDITLFYDLVHLKDEVSMMVENAITILNNAEENWVDEAEDGDSGSGDGVDWARENEAYFPIFQLLVRALATTTKRLDVLEALVFACRMIESPHQVPQAISELKKWATAAAGGTTADWPYVEEWKRDDSDNGCDDDLGCSESDCESHGRSDPAVESYTHSPRLLKWLYARIAAGKPLVIGSCVIGQDQTMTAVFDLDSEAAEGDVQNVLTPLHQLEYTFAKSGMGIDQGWYSWCVKKSAGISSFGDSERARLEARLQCLPILTTDEEEEEAKCTYYNQVQISPGLWDITGFVHGNWSPRLSRVGFLLPDDQTKSWRMESLGNEASYYVVK